MSDNTTRRAALKCMAYGAGTAFALAGGIPVSFPLAEAADSRYAGVRPLFVQISDSHIGFNKDANPDVNGTLARVVAVTNDLPAQPAFILHTGDITHLSKAEEFDRATQLLKGLRTSELHTTPGEHDVIDQGTIYFAGFGRESAGKGYYSFDSQGVHFVGLINVLNFKQGGLGTLGNDQLDWLESDLKDRPASQPIVVFAHMPLWTIYAPWGWGTSDSDQAFALLRRFGSVTVLNGHIHQIVQKVEGNMTFHTARSTAYPQPVAGAADAPGPLKVPTDKLASMLGLTSVSQRRHVGAISITDRALV